MGQALLTSCKLLNHKDATMNHCYELMLVVRPDQSDQVPEMIERYKAIIVAAGGSVDRAEVVACSAANGNRGGARMGFVM